MIVNQHPNALLHILFTWILCFMLQSIAPNRTEYSVFMLSSSCSSLFDIWQVYQCTTSTGSDQLIAFLGHIIFHAQDLTSMYVYVEGSPWCDFYRALGSGLCALGMCICFDRDGYFICACSCLLNTLWRPKWNPTWDIPNIWSWSLSSMVLVHKPDQKGLGSVVRPEEHYILWQETNVTKKHGYFTNCTSHWWNACNHLFAIPKTSALLLL